MRFERPLVLGLCFSAMLAIAAPAAAQPVSVSGAEPNVGEQETVGLQVRVKGKGFATGARAEFLLDDNSTGGITVEETTFVSSTEVVAKINIAAGASLSLFDIRVVNLNGRTGRGSDLFQVVQKGGPAACTTEPIDPARFELVGTLNYLIGGTPAFGPNLGVSASLAPVTLALPGPDTRTVLVAAVGTPRTTGRVEFFVLDATSGGVLDGQALCASCATQPHVSVPIPRYSGEQAGSGHMATGDVNADGIPDFAVSDHSTGSASVFIGAVTTDGRLLYQGVLLPRPTSNSFYGFDIAVGDLDGVAGDEIAIARIASGSGKKASPAAIFLYRFNGITPALYQTFTPNATPAVRTDDGYGWSIAIGDVNNDGKPDLITGVPSREVAGVTDAGAVFVHAGIGTASFSQNPVPLVLSTAVRVIGDLFGTAVTAGDGDSNGVLDVVALSDRETGQAHGEVLQGPVLDGQQANPTFSFEPRPGIDTQWSQRAPRVGDLNGDGLQDLVLGLPGASTNTSSSCDLQGLVYVFLGTGTGWTRLSIQGPLDPGGGTFGYGTATADGYPFIVVGNNQFNLANESTPAGQAFIYRVKNP